MIHVAPHQLTPFFRCRYLSKSSQIFPTTYSTVLGGQTFTCRLNNDVEKTGEPFSTPFRFCWTVPLNLFSREFLLRLLGICQNFALHNLQSCAKPVSGIMQIAWAGQWFQFSAYIWSVYEIIVLIQSCKGTVAWEFCKSSVSLLYPYSSSQCYGSGFDLQVGIVSLDPDTKLKPAKNGPFS